MQGNQSFSNHRPAADCCAASSLWIFSFSACMLGGEGVTQGCERRLKEEVSGRARYEHRLQMSPIKQRLFAKETWQYIEPANRCYHVAQMKGKSEQSLHDLGKLWKVQPEKNC